MIVVTVPDDEDVIARQNGEKALYFSIAADSVIRRTGVVNVRQTPLSLLDLSDPRCRPVLTRMAHPSATQLATISGRSFACEGPLDDQVLSALGLRAETAAVASFDLHEPDGRFRWRVRRSESSFLSEAGVDQVAEWQSAELPIQIMTGAIDDVRLVGRLPDGREFPAVFRAGRAWISAFPLFDIGGEFLTFPPLQGPWSRRDTMTRYEEMAGVIIGNMVAHLAADHIMPVVRVGDWPQGYAAALCVRHDYDRPIGDASMAALLDFYNRRGLVSATGFLSYNLPRDQIRALVERGHEIQIHVWQPDRQQFLDDCAALSQLVGERIAGATAHGNERGFRGDAHYEWFEAAGLEYAELFSVSHAPAPIYRLAASEVLRRSSLMGTPWQFGLDVNNNPEEHRLEATRQAVGAALQAGGTVIPMNHPDINRAALYELLDEVTGSPLDGEFGDLWPQATWRASLRDIVRWTRQTRFDSTVEYLAGQVSLRFPAALPLPLPVSIGRVGEEQIYSAGAGDDRLVVPIGGAS